MLVCGILIMYICAKEECDIILNLKEKNAFSSGVALGQVSHAYIIEGAKGVGKLDFALFAAARLMCTGESKPCLECSQCKKVMAKAHPDMWVLGTDKPCVVADARRIIKDAYLIPNDGEKKVYIIANADKANRQTQNAMLKILEEPPSSVVFFLLAERKDMLLATVKSRCRTVTLNGMDEEEILQLLRQKYPRKSEESLKEAARLCGRSIGEAEELLSKDSVVETNRAHEFLHSYFDGGDKYSLFVTVLKGKQKRESNLLFLSLLHGAFADILRVKCGVGRCNVLSLQQASVYARKKTRRSVAVCLKTVERACVAIAANGNYTAVISDMLIKLGNERK